ncbi:alanine/glycine:cation symporter family protein [Methanolobus profundi]|uniref:Alanine or glycine:cation symporter, AGCS family n=1 Tax=Methanolobus profundi TaxID=487685 RepID=A0A1I4PJK9_9EURY|nr:sodium:alanine symporter family protein [Methanolobus profundi]SFM27999.1 alanine or glycine:cation symporter, AGCS family [Methanolobus profundi]
MGLLDVIGDILDSSSLITYLTMIDSFVWGPPLLALLVGTGAFYTFKLGFLQVKRLPLALKYVIRSGRIEDGSQGDISSFGALSTALAATVGTGNIVGVATAIKTGGPGALFWMWVAAFFGMATMYAECLLSVKYRTFDENGQVSGGPMYYIKNGLADRSYSGILSKMFAIFGIFVGCMGIGTFAQMNAIVDSANITFGIPVLWTGAVVTVLVFLVIIGGIRSIAKVAQLVVPFMATAYVLGSLLILLLNMDQVPSAFSLVLSSAFSRTAATGGFLGASIMMAIQFGVARGVFSNEAGLGSTPIAAAAAKVKSPVKQGLISMTATFFDTIIVCSMTGLVLIISGSWKGELAGAYMTNYAYTSVLENMGTYVVGVGLMFFAFTTILGWNYYAERCTEFLFGVKAILPFKFVYISMVALGAFLTLDVIWVLADIFNGLMAIPNLIALIALRKIVISETREYFEEIENGS